MVQTKPDSKEDQKTIPDAYDDANKALDEKGDYEEKYNPYYVYRQDEVAYSVQSNNGNVCGGCRFWKGYDWQPCYIVKNKPLPIVSGGWCNKYESLIEVMLEVIGMDESDFLSVSVDIDIDDEDIEISEASASENVFQKLVNYFTKDEAQAEPSIEMSGFKLMSNGRWVGWFSNNFEDKEGETFSAKAIANYVSRVTSKSLPMPELWYYHIKGSKFGEADSVFQVGHFVIASGSFDDTPLSKHMQKWMTDNPQDVRMSHGFFYNPKYKKDKVYHDFATFEVSVLDKGAEANPFTPFNILGDVKMKITEQQKQALRDKLPVAIADEIISGAEKSGKKLRDAQVAYKSNDDSPNDDNSDVMLEVMGKMFNRLDEIEEKISSTPQAEPANESTDEKDDSTNQYVMAMEDSLNDIKAQVDRLSETMLSLTRRQPRASKSDETLISDNDGHANFVHRKNYEQSKGKPVGLIQQMAEVGAVELSKAFPSDDDDLPPPPSAE